MDWPQPKAGEAGRPLGRVSLPRRACPAPHCLTRRTGPGRASRRSPRPGRPSSVWLSVRRLGRKYPPCTPSTVATLHRGRTGTSPCGSGPPGIMSRTGLARAGVTGACSDGLGRAEYRGDDCLGRNLPPCVPGLGVLALLLRCGTTANERSSVRDWPAAVRLPLVHPRGPFLPVPVPSLLAITHALPATLSALT